MFWWTSNLVSPSPVSESPQNVRSSLQMPGTMARGYLRLSQSPTCHMIFPNGLSSSSGISQDAFFKFYKPGLSDSALFDWLDQQRDLILGNRNVSMCLIFT